MSRSDRLALGRAEQMLGAAPPAVVEQVHTEAFERLTAAEREAAFDRLTAATGGGDRPADASPAALGRAAARVEARQRGGLARALGTDGPGAALSSAVSAAILGVVAAYAASSAAWEAWGAEGDDEPPSYGGGGIGDFGF
ncbi:hypothetical protein [Promicromonospora sukumoe]|uniref:hypothetical protein n=1 Tax=Promicromonospora sukumoe TaxID=88382 RepID=UPI000367AB43|nr:hypothetical protein [Promicromonospora sukumoe]